MEYIEKMELLLEGNDYKSIDMVAPFIGAFVDRCCGDNKECSNTKVFVGYAEMVSLMLSYDRDPLWDKEKVNRLRELIQHLNK